MSRRSSAEVVKACGGAGVQAYVIQPGAFNIQDDAACCRKQCKGMSSCNAWMFCSRRGGCDDGYTYRPEW